MRARYLGSDLFLHITSATPLSHTDCIEQTVKHISKLTEDVGISRCQQALIAFLEVPSERYKHFASPHLRSSPAGLSQIFL